MHVIVLTEYTVPIERHFQSASMGKEAIYGWRFDVNAIVFLILEVLRMPRRSMNL